MLYNRTAVYTSGFSDYSCLSDAREFVLLSSGTSFPLLDCIQQKRPDKPRCFVYSSNAWKSTNFG